MWRRERRAGSAALRPRSTRWKGGRRTANAVLVSRGNCPTWGFCMAFWPQLVLVPVDGGSEKALVPTNGSSQDTDRTGCNCVVAGRSTIVFDKDGLQFDQLPDGQSRQAMAADSDWQFSLLNWSPDGQWFSFTRSHSRGDRQFEVNADGSGLKRLDDLSGWNDWPAWDEGEVPSPDGSKSAVLGDPLQIKDAQSGSAVPVDEIHGGQASWSADGKTLAFTTCPSDGASPSAIYLVNGDGTALKQLTNGSSHDCEPVFSPDGQKVAFVREQTNTEQVVVLDLNTLQENVLFSVAETDGGISNVWPAWSPDGKLLAWFVQGMGIYVIRADGSARSRWLPVTGPADSTSAYAGNRTAGCISFPANSPGPVAFLGGSRGYLQLRCQRCAGEFHHHAGYRPGPGVVDGRSAPCSYPGSGSWLGSVDARNASQKKSALARCDVRSDMPHFR